MTTTPSHYAPNGSGIAAAYLVECLPFWVGQTAKYVIRHKKKGQATQDMQKALDCWNRAKAQWEGRGKTWSGMDVLARDHDYQIMRDAYLDAEEDADLVEVLQRIMECPSSHADFELGRLNILAALDQTVPF